MATNRYHEEGNQIYVTVGSGVTSGDPVTVGQVPGVALYDADADDKAVIQTDGVFLLDVVGNDGAPAVIAEGDILYDNAGVINSNSAGVRFGYALEGVGSGLTVEIKVKIGY